MTRALLESPDTDPFALRVVDGIEGTDAMLARRGVPWVMLDGTPDEEKDVSIDAVAPSVLLPRALLV